MCGQHCPVLSFQRPLAHMQVSQPREPGFVDLQTAALCQWLPPPGGLPVRSCLKLLFCPKSPSAKISQNLAPLVCARPWFSTQIPHPYTHEFTDSEWALSDGFKGRGNTKSSSYGDRKVHSLRTMTNRTRLLNYYF